MSEQKRARGLTLAQFDVLKRWLDGSGSSRKKGFMTGARMPFVRQLVHKGFLATQSTLPFVGRRQGCMVLYITDAGVAALKAATKE